MPTRTQCTSMLSKALNPPARSASLTQTAIDRAFASKQRESKLSFTNKDTTITILSGKNTGRLGVEELGGGSGFSDTRVSGYLSGQYSNRRQIHEKAKA